MAMDSNGVEAAASSLGDAEQLRSEGVKGEAAPVVEAPKADEPQAPAVEQQPKIATTVEEVKVTTTTTEVEVSTEVVKATAEVVEETKVAHEEVKITHEEVTTATEVVTTVTEEVKVATEEAKTTTTEEVKTTTAEEVKTAVEEVKTVAEVAKSATEELKPAAEEITPAQEESKAIVEEVKSATEQVKTAAEETKVLVEESKIAAEVKATAEEVKTTAEVKVAAEEIKTSKEESKTSTEDAKVTAEEVKTAAVKVKTTTEETKVAAEETKVAAEEVKFDAEEVKVDAEAKVTTQEVKVATEEAKVTGEITVDVTSVSEDTIVTAEELTPTAKDAQATLESTLDEADVATEENGTDVAAAPQAVETEELEMEPPVAVSTTPPKSKKWLGGILPKVPSILKKNNHTEKSEQPAPASSQDSDHSEENAEPVDELRSLTEQPVEKEKTTVASRLRGLSIEQNAFARSIVGKFNGFRTQSSNESPRNSIDGMPPQQRRSLLGSLGGSTNNNGVPSPRSDPSLKARRGACVATKFGTGTVLDIRLDDGFYIVQLVPKSIAYLQEDMIIREIKSVVGERVKTRWGLATVEQYYADEDMYNIALDWRWDDDHVWRMKATTKKFEKISRSMSIVQNTKNKIFEGYSTIRESASFGYANVAAKINTASTYKPAPRTSQTEHKPLKSRGESLGKALTPYGVGTVIEVRPDQSFVVMTKCGATAYLNAESVKLLHRRTNFAAGERVKTPYGQGEVVVYRDEDEVYEVKLDIPVAAGSAPPMLYISDVHAESMMAPSTSSGPNYARLSSIFTMTRNSVYSASASVKASATGGFTTLSNVKSKVSSMAAIKLAKPKFQKGERVITSFGSGFVSDCRPLERIYEVQLRRLKFRGYFHESTLQAFPYERVTHFIVDGKTIPAPEMPKNLPEHKRRDIINTAIRQARHGR